MKLSKIFLDLFKELILWLLLPILFVVYYMYFQSNPVESAVAHLYLIAQIAAFVFMLRGLISLTIPNKKISASIASFIYAVCLFSLLFYYILIYVGLNTWGRVITEELIVSYSYQIKALCDALGFPYLIIKITLLIAFAICWFLLYLYVFNTKLIAYFQHKLQSIASHWIQVLLIATLTILASYPLFDYPYNTLKYIQYKEPISLTLWAGKPQNAKHSATQGNRLNNLLNQRELEVASSYRAASNIKKSNIILIVVDALRPSNMGIYGYTRNTTPHLNLLKDTGAVTKVNHVSASCAESACGLISIASSRFIHLMPEAPFTLQQVLKRYGYKTRMILGGDHTNFYNLKDLYGPVDSYFDASMSKKSSYYANDDNIALDEAKLLPEWDHSPVMFQFHLMSAHPMGKRLLPYHAYMPMKNYNGMTRGNTNLKYINFYDNGVLQTDAMINNLLKTLQSKHYLDDAIVVITADHGEALGEHQIYAHANGVFEEQLKIPFIFISYMPDQPAIKQVKKIVSQVDIAPSILFELGMNIPQNWNGSPIQLPQEPDFTYFHLHPNEGLYDYRKKNSHYKYWINMQNGEEFVYNLSIDPNERNNIVHTVISAQKKFWRIKLSVQH
jgi:glucan phosphoethanolaminetransferase (alkaline phosphatase superfamily)